VGFTAGGAIVDNLFILQECVHEVYRRKEELVLVAVDFKKAYDSIKREMIIEVLKEYRVDVRVIDVVKRVYCEDKTRIELGEGCDVEMDVESGIRQGCTASTLIFKLITFKIIEVLRRKLRGVQMGVAKVRCLFYADDGLMLARSAEEAKTGIEELRRVAEKYGLEMNVRKSQCMQFNTEREVSEIAGVEVVREIKYLGVKVQNGRNLFDKHRVEMVNRAKWMSSMTSSVIEKSCHRVMVGKSYWKGVVLPRVLYGAEVVRLKVEDMNSIQKQENAAMRRMLEAGRGVAIAGMRGEIGMGTVRSRVARGRIQYWRRVEQGGNELLKRVLRATIQSGGEWVRETRKNMNWAEVRENEIKDITKEEVKRRVARKVHMEWRQEMEGKSSLRIYRLYKNEMKEEDYEGGGESRVWFAARTRSLKLACRRWGEDSVRCRMCGAEREDDTHFLLECALYDGIRELHGGAAET